MKSVYSALESSVNGSPWTYQYVYPQNRAGTLSQIRQQFQFLLNRQA